MGLFRRGLRHPFYPALKPSPALRAKSGSRAVAGTFEELLAAGMSGLRVSRAVFPLRKPTSPFLPEAEREALWSFFQVPVYSILLDLRGRVIGYECEVQRGLHLADDYTGGLLFGTVQTVPCDCGRPGARLLPHGAEPLIEARVAASAILPRGPAY